MSKIFGTHFIFVVHFLVVPRESISTVLARVKKSRPLLGAFLGGFAQPDIFHPINQFSSFSFHFFAISRKPHLK
jgi:hypothetical protein